MRARLWRALSTALAPSRGLPVVAYRHDIGDYMHRWIVAHPFGTVRLHHIRRPDADPDMHTHPFDFASFILCGWYTEERLDEFATLETGDQWVRYRRLGPLAVNTLTGATPHRVVEVSRGGAWTLVLTGPKVRSWGFLTPAGFVPWREYVTNKTDIDLDSYADTIAQVYG